MSDESDDLRALEFDPEGDAIATLFEPELQDEARAALRSLKQGVVDAAKARKAAEARARDLHHGCNVTTRQPKNPY